MTDGREQPTDFDLVLDGLKQAVAIHQGRADPASYRVHHPRSPEAVDVKAIRARLGLSQASFAQRFGFATRTVQDWEQRRRRPEASARVLLTIIDREPEAVERALSPTA